MSLSATEGDDDDSSLGKNSVRRPSSLSRPLFICIVAPAQDCIGVQKDEGCYLHMLRDRRGCTLYCLEKIASEGGEGTQESTIKSLDAVFVLRRFP